MTEFLCPVCGKKLSSSGTAFSCPAGHSFDIARSGYVNLLTNSGSGRHGDDKLMVRARTRFLDKGFYAPLADRLAELAAVEKPDLIVDAGCGEGYYTDMLSRISPHAEVIGLDISKDAIAAAAKRCRVGRFAVASIAGIPLEDGCADVLLNVFSPFFPAEFARVLKSGALLLRVIPLEMHLHALRELVYDTPYDNDVPELDADGFETEGFEELRYSIRLESREDIEDLFRMTPYYYKTSAADQDKLRRAEQLETEIEFGIIRYRKI